jgi:hypothetical protein
VFGVRGGVEEFGELGCIKQVADVVNRHLVPPGRASGVAWYSRRGEATFELSKVVIDRGGICEPGCDRTAGGDTTPF